MTRLAPDSFSGDGEQSSASRLLRLAMQPSVQPAELLIEFALSQRTDGWIQTAFQQVASCAGAPLRLDAPLLADVQGAQDIATSRVWREAAKRLYETGVDVEQRMGGLFVYACCVAESINRCGTTGSSERRDVIDGLLGAAASIAPEPWRQRFEQALTTDTSAKEEIRE